MMISAAFTIKPVYWLRQSTGAQFRAGQFISLFMLLLLAMPSIAHSQQLQRLFTLPQDRQMIDELRRLPPPALVQDEASPIIESTDYITLNGLIISNNGTATVWVNNDWAAYQGGFHIDIQRATAAQVPVILSAGEVCLLKPGQTLNTSTGTIRDILNPEQACVTNPIRGE